MLEELAKIRIFLVRYATRLLELGERVEALAVELLRERPHHAHRLRFRFRTDSFQVGGTVITFTMKFDKQVTGSIGPADANGNPGQSTLSAAAFSSSDPTVFTVAADPANPLGFVLTGVKVGTATLNATATATEPDGTVHPVADSASIVLTPDAPVTTGLIFTFGTPTPIPAGGGTPAPAPAPAP